MRVLRDPPPPVDEPLAHSRHRQPSVVDGCRAGLELHFSTTVREHRFCRVTPRRVLIVDAQRTATDQRRRGRHPLVARPRGHINTDEGFSTLDGGQEWYQQRDVDPPRWGGRRLPSTTNAEAGWLADEVVELLLPHQIGDSGGTSTTWAPDISWPSFSCATFMPSATRIHRLDKRQAS